MIGVLLSILAYWLGWRQRAKRDVYTDYHRLHMRKLSEVIYQMFHDIDRHDKSYKVRMPRWLYDSTIKKVPEGRVAFTNKEIADELSEFRKEDYDQINYN